MTISEHLNEFSSGDREDFLSLVNRLRSLSMPAVSPQLTDRILAAVKCEAERDETPSRHFLPSAFSSYRFRKWMSRAAILVLLLALAASILWKSGDPTSPLPNDLDWIASLQEQDGSWSPSRAGGCEAYRPALTALAALALASRDPASDTVQSACRALISMQQNDGSFGQKGRVQSYNQSITAFALAALLPTHNGLRPALEKAVNRIAYEQTQSGGWDYEDGSQGNTALTAWNVRMLSLAERQGIAEARLPLRKGLRWLRNVMHDNGTVVYHRGGQISQSESLRALTAHAFLTAGASFDGLPLLGKRIIRELSSSSSESKPADSYRDYAKVIAFRAAGERTEADTVRKAWHPNAKADTWGEIGGRLYSASLFALADAR
ncbi:MAG: terpene cyclase/mutase family protein [Kiritimatiellae bacterium]|nr:terpene cyclase/mutase family protein [Kiritimatiellia bacterium]